MDVELLVTAGCPHETKAVALLRTALDDVGLGSVDITATVVTTPEQAELRGFSGSPTILLDGRDPFAEPGQTPALACRVYPTPTGHSGIPDLRALRQALKRAAHADGRGKART